MKMRNIRIWFTDFGRNFRVDENFILDLLAPHYDVVIDRENPEYLFYSAHGDDHLEHDAIRIFYTGENLSPDFNICDYAIGFDDMSFGDRYLRFPNFALYFEQLTNLLSRSPISAVDIIKMPQFCNFIYSNPDADPVRDTFFNRLNARRSVISAGKHLNNVKDVVGERYSPDWRISKIPMMQTCRFSIAFENASRTGYTTEKLLHGLVARTIPIYWGNPNAARDFNPAAFINVHSYPDLDAVVEAVLRLDSDPEAMVRMLNEPAFEGDVLPAHLIRETIEAFLCQIIDQPLEGARRRARYASMKMYEEGRLRARKIGKIRDRFPISFLLRLGKRSR